MTKLEKPSAVALTDESSPAGNREVFQTGDSHFRFAAHPGIK